jgi:hypothetical protein
MGKRNQKKKKISRYPISGIPNINVTVMVLEYLTTSELFLLTPLCKSYRNLFHSTALFRKIKFNTQMCNYLPNTKKIVEFLEKFK